MGQAIRGARQTPIAVVEQGRLVLRVGGVIQSVGVDETYQADIWDALLPHNQPTNALILGLGGGTIAHLMTQRFGPLPITGVECDPAVVWLARQQFGLGCSGLWELGFEHLGNTLVIQLARTL